MGTSEEAEEALIVITAVMTKEEALSFEVEFAEWIIATRPTWNEDPSPVNLEISLTIGGG